MNRLSMAQLRAVEAIVRNGRLTRAAAELHLTQPALSMQVRQAGEIAGEPLFEPRGRTLVPTAAGLRVAEAGREVARTLESLAADLADRRGLKTGHLRLAAATTAEYFAPDLLGGFHARFPGIDIHLEVLNRAQVLERFARRADDLYLMARPPEGRDIVSLPILDNPLVPIAARRHRLAARKSVSLAEFVREPFVAREPGSGTRLITDEFFARRGVQVEARMTLGSNEAIKHAVGAGFGCAVISSRALASASGIARLAVAGFPLRSFWHVVRAGDARLSPAAGAFIEFARTWSAPTR
ncbi:MAG: LysR family transcriptional regulator [Burkholderiales bacterium]|nr:LysR family transcriptional regulator [Burkholderiales bacterium]